MLQAYNILSLQALLASNDRVLDLLALGQRPVPFAANRAVVHEHVHPVFALDKAVALGVVEPLHIAGFTCCHLFILLFYY
ncbi:Cold shock protein [Pseudomonas sp. IT-347P]